MDIKKVFQEQQSIINNFFNTLDYEDIMRFVKHLMDCKGTVFFTGVGKSGIIAQHLGHMMTSVGLTAGYLDALTALHGDLGCVNSGDILVLISKSGETAELMPLVIAARAKGAYLIALVCSNKECSLAKVCNDCFILPLTKELCPFGLAPLTSGIIQLAFGNTIIAILMRLKGIDLKTFALNHPAGNMGKKIKRYTPI